MCEVFLHSGGPSPFPLVMTHICTRTYFIYGFVDLLFFGEKIKVQLFFLLHRFQRGSRSFHDISTYGCRHSKLLIVSLPRLRQTQCEISKWWEQNLTWMNVFLTTSSGVHCGHGSTSAAMVSSRKTSSPPLADCGQFLSRNMRKHYLNFLQRVEMTGMIMVGKINKSLI